MTSIVFIPGASSDAQVWHNQIDAFKHGFQCQGFDLTGFNSIDAMADHVLKAAPPHFVLCGTSMGGYVSLAIMRKAKSRVDKLILLNTSARADTAERKALRQIDIDKGEAAYIAERRRNGHFSAFLSPHHANDKVLIAELLETALRVGFGCFANHQTACMNRAGSLDLLPSINTPTLVVGGTDDTLIPPECQAELARYIPDAKLVMLKQCGHIAHLEEPEELNKSIEQFLQETNAP